MYCMHTLTPQQVRAREFAELIEATDRVLRHPYVQEALGEIAVDLAKINDSAFLPDITGGVVRIPEQHRPTNHVAVMPVAYQAVRPKFWLPTMYQRVDGSYFFDASASQPTPNMKRMVFDRLMNEGWSEEDAESFIGTTSADQSSLTIIATPEPGDASVNYEEIDEPETATRLTSRPLIRTNFVPRTLSAIEKAFSMVHEYAHVIDIESSCERPEEAIKERAARESKAYNIEVEARLALRAAGFKPWNSQDEERAFAVEYARRQHTCFDDPFATPPQLIAQYQDMAILN